VEHIIPTRLLSSRRRFLKTAGAGSLALAATPALAETGSSFRPRTGRYERTFKRVHDYRSFKRLWEVNSEGAFRSRLGRRRRVFCRQGGWIAVAERRPCAGVGPQLKGTRSAKRSAFAGDPQRAIRPCSACHGPGCFTIGVPALQSQQGAYIERQLGAFAQGTRQNDIYSQMRDSRQSAHARRNALCRGLVRHARQPPISERVSFGRPMRYS
jgi:cytochrome c553